MRYHVRKLALSSGRARAETVCGICSSIMPGVYCSYRKGACGRGRIPYSTRPHAAHLCDYNPPLFHSLRPGDVAKTITNAIMGDNVAVHSS